MFYCGLNYFAMHLYHYIFLPGIGVYYNISFEWSWPGGVVSKINDSMLAWFDGLRWPGGYQQATRTAHPGNLQVVLPRVGNGKTGRACAAGFEPAHVYSI